MLIIWKLTKSIVGHTKGPRSPHKRPSRAICGPSKCNCCWGPFWKQSAHLLFASEYIRRVDNRFFTKNEKNLHANHLEWASKKGGPRQVPRSPPLKHTTG